MTKRIFALLLCAATLFGTLVFTGCSSEEENEDKGQLITMYLSENVYDLDPANAYNNEAVSKVVSLLFDTLFTLDENGKVKKSLVKEYVIKENAENGEYTMQLYLNEGAKWSDGTAVSANDIVFAWQRLLRPENNYEAASLLFDIKNARAAKEGDASIDDVGIYPAEQQMLEINFEGKIDYDQFILNLTSIALAPLRDDIVSKGEDWAKKAGTMVCSGPFKMGRINMTGGSGDEQGAVYIHPDAETTKYFDALLYEETVGSDYTPAVEATDDAKGFFFAEQRITDFLIERNTYYYRDYEKDKLDKSVTPYKICVDCSMTNEQLTAMYEAGAVMYIGDIPLSLRSEGAIADAAKIAETSMSTNSIYLNQKALIANGTDTPEAIFADKAVRQALSMAIDRDTIAKAVVYAEIAKGLLPSGLFEAGNRKETFRENCTESYPALSFDLTAAKQALAGADLAHDPSAYEICLTVAAYDDVHCAIAEMIVKAWQDLGFTKASVKKVGTITNNDYSKYVEGTPTDICDDLYAEQLRAGCFQAILVDYVAYSVDPFSMLAPFAKAFSGRGMDMSNPDHYELTPHITGFENDAYNTLMETIFAEKSISARADLYRQAEAILMEEMPVIPVVYNLNATITNKNLKKVTTRYSGIANFRKSTVKNYSDYLDAGYDYLVENFKPTTEDVNAIIDAISKIPSVSDSVKGLSTDAEKEAFVMEYPLNFKSDANKQLFDVYRLHPMWNLRCVSATGCSYTGWTFFRDANSVYGHFFINEKARLAAEEESRLAAESANA